MATYGGQFTLTIDICLAENVRNDEVIFAEIKAMVYGPTFHAALLHSART